MKMLQRPLIAQMEEQAIPQTIVAEQITVLLVWLVEELEEFSYPMCIH